MARINIDDQFWVEIMPVVAALGDADRAVGQVVRFFKLAQEKHKNGKLVSEEDFARGKFHESLIGPFADRVDGGIQAVGAQKHFGWLAKRVEAGRLGGKQTQANASKTEQPEASPSYSPSYSPSESGSPSCEEPRVFASAAYGFDSDESLFDAIPIVTREKWEKKLGSPSKLRALVKEAFEYHNLDPANVPRTPGSWMKKLFTWIDIGKDKAKSNSNSLDDLELIPKERPA